MSAYPMVMDGGGDVEAPYTLIGLYSQRKTTIKIKKLY